MEVLSTLRSILEYVNTTDAGIAGNGGVATDTTIVRDGDKYEFAIDGVLLNIDEFEAHVWQSKVKLSISTFPEGGEQKLLVGFPYSCRGTRQNPKYIPLAKDNGYPRLPQNKKIYYKILNDSENAEYFIKGVAFVVLGYPVLETK